MSVEFEPPKDVSDIIGKFGLWQKMVFGFVSYIVGAQALGSVHLTFLMPVLKIRCAQGAGNESYTMEDTACYFMSNGSNQPCSRWDYDHSFYKRTLTESFNLVCSRDHIRPMFNTIQQIAEIIAAFSLFPLGDKFGRRPVLLICLVPMVGYGALSIIGQENIALFLVSKFCMGFSGLVVYYVFFVLLMEVVGTEYRGPLGLIICFGWSLGYLTVPLIAYLIRDSFYIQLTLVVLQSFTLLTVLVPESPRWQVAHGNLNEAEKTLKRAAKWNGTPVPHLRAQVDMLALVIKQSSNDQKLDLRDFFRTVWMRTITLVMLLFWFCNALVYWGISLNSNIFGGNEFLNFTYFAIVEFPSNGLAVWLAIKRPRIPSLVVLLVGAGICVLASIPIPEDILWLRVFLVVGGKFFINACYNILFPYTSEVFPTTMRSTAMGICGFTARCGSIAATFAGQAHSKSSLNAVLGTFGTLALISAFLMSFLPETKDIKLPDTVQDVPKRKR